MFSSLLSELVLELCSLVGKPSLSSRDRQARHFRYQVKHYMYIHIFTYTCIQGVGHFVVGYLSKSCLGGSIVYPTLCVCCMVCTEIFILKHKRSRYVCLFRALDLRRISCHVHVTHGPHPRPKVLWFVYSDPMGQLDNLRNTKHNSVCYTKW